MIKILIKGNSLKNIILFLLMIVMATPSSAQFKNLSKKLKSKAAESVKKNVKPLTINYKIKKIHYNPLISLTKVSLDIEFNGYNPNKIGVSLDRIEFDLFIDDKHGSKFYNEKKIKIPKEDNFTFEEVAELKVNTMGKAIFDQIIKKKAKYRIDGTYFLDTQFGNFPIKAKLVEKEL